MPKVTITANLGGRGHVFSRALTERSFTRLATGAHSLVATSFAEVGRALEAMFQRIDGRAAADHLVTITIVVTPDHTAAGEAQA